MTTHSCQPSETCVISSFIYCPSQSGLFLWVLVLRSDISHSSWLGTAIWQVMDWWIYPAPYYIFFFLKTYCRNILKSERRLACVGEHQEVFHAPRKAHLSSEAGAVMQSPSKSFYEAHETISTHHKVHSNIIKLHFYSFCSRIISTKSSQSPPGKLSNLIGR